MFFALSAGAAAMSACTGAPLEELLAGKACDGAGRCAPGYECEASSRICVPVGTAHQGGGGSSTGCDTVADCPAPASACEVPICLAHACGTLPTAAGPLPAQTAGDCTLIVCDGLGNPEEQNDDGDVPVDASDCTDDLCLGGLPQNPPLGLGTPCSSGGGVSCDGAGQCVACVAAADCTSIVPDECVDRACQAGTCQPIYAPDGTPLGLQTTGDCQLGVCDGAGAPTTADDDGDLPADDNPCTDDVCTAGVPSNPPVAAGIGCGGSLTCDGAGHCTGCTDASDCPGTDSFCQQRVCDAGQCGFNFTADGTPLPAGGQITGDCREMRCNGTGGVKEVAANGDLPADDGEQCTLETCNNGAPLHPPAPLGAACTEGDGAVCDGAGQCVACNAPGDCQNQGAACQSATCANHVCGLANVAAGTPAPAGAQTSGDCKLVVCDGSGVASVQPNVGDLPVDGNDCTGDVCTGSTPSNPPLAASTPCAGGGTCDGAGNCSVKKPNGASCSAPIQCTSGFCVDGVCCGSACGALCRACSAAKTGGTNGTCGNVLQGQDPDLECTAPETCNGSAACGFTCGQEPTPPAASCPAACTGGCLGGVCVIDCNAAGSCAGQTLACPQGFACQVQCGGNTSCDGATVDCPALYACDVTCSGSCSSATINCGTGTCDLACTGNKCQGAQLTCGPNRCSATCQGGTAVPAVSCNGSCDCTSCLHDDGAACSNGSQCLSGVCQDGVCCNVGCASLCEACDLGGLVGTCSVVPAGQDPANECAGSATCNGGGACSLKAPGDSCTQGSECQSSFCAESVCCATACGSLCESCLSVYNGGAGDGTCGFIDNGLDPYHECPGPRVCTGAGTCTN